MARPPCTSKLPAARNFKASKPGWREIKAGVGLHFSDAGTVLLFCLSFLLMGSFVSLYNYIGYHLLAGPFHLSPSKSSAIAWRYLLGIHLACTSPERGRVARHRLI